MSRCPCSFGSFFRCCLFGLSCVPSDALRKSKDRYKFCFMEKEKVLELIKYFFLSVYVAWVTSKATAVTIQISRRTKPDKNLTTIGVHCCLFAVFSTNYSAAVKYAELRLISCLCVLQPFFFCERTLFFVFDSVLCVVHTSAGSTCQLQSKLQRIIRGSF